MHICIFVETFMHGAYGLSLEPRSLCLDRIQIPAPTIISILISTIVSIIVSIIISIMISIIIIVMNVKTLIINISTLSLIHTSSINDIQNNIMVRAMPL